MSLTQRVFSGAAMQLGVQLFNRLVGLISTLILARLLVPSDFGIVAIVVIVIQFFETLSDAGTHNYVVQKSELDDQDLNTAFSIEVMLKSLIAVALVPGAWWVGQWYALPELYPALLVASLAMLARACRNPGYSVLIKEIDYNAIFKLSLAQKAAGFVITVGWALISPSFWALIAGELVGTVLFTVGTYRIHAHRPKFTLAKMKEQWLFSQWSLLRGFVGFVRSQLDTIMVSRLFSPTQLGAYHLQRDLAVMPALLVVMPAMEPLMAALAKSKDDTELFAFRFRVAFLFLFITLLPLTGILWNFSEGITLIALGEQWVEYHELIKYFSLLFITYCLFGLVADSFVALGKIRELFVYDVASTAFLAVMLFLLAGLDIVAFAFWRGVIGVLVTVGVVVYLDYGLKLHLIRLATLLFPAVLAVAAAQGFIIPILDADDSVFTKALIGIPCYCFTYLLLTLPGYWFFLCFHKNKELKALQDFTVVGRGTLR